MTIECFIRLYLILSIIQITRADIYVYNYNSTKVFETIEDDDSKDGQYFPNAGLKGYLIKTNPTDACQPIASAPSIQYPGYQWIALIRRSTPQEAPCHFTTKIINAYNANFSAVIIYNYEDALISMSLSDADTFIPATFITHTDGLNLINRYLFNLSLPAKNISNRYYLKIVPSNFMFNWPSYIIPFIAIITMSFLCLLGFILSRWCIERRRNRHHRLPRSALKQLQVKKFVKSDPWDVCAICLDDFEEGAKLRILPCQHAYHMKCIDPWLINNRRQCPCCKRYVFPNMDNSDEENDHQRNAQTPTERTPLITNVQENSASTLSTNQNVAEQQTVHLLTTGTSFLDSSDDEKDDFLSSIPTRTTTTTTTDSRRYGSFNGSINNARAANSYNGSMNYTTDNTNLSNHSILEDMTDTTSIDEQTNHIEDNQAFVNDEQSTDTNQIHL